MTKTLLEDALIIYRDKFGDHCTERLDLISNEVDGWAGKGTKGLNDDSLRLSIEFLKVYPLRGLSDVATVFMDMDGHLIFYCELDAKRAIEITFYPNTVGVFIDSDNTDVVFDGINENLISHVKKYLR